MSSLFERAFKPAAVVVVGAGFAPAVMAQASASLCNFSLAYAPVLAQVPAAALPVPTLTLLSLGILSAAVGVVAWSKASSAKKKMLSVAVMGAALGLSALGGNGLVQEVRAAGMYAFSNAQGGVVADAEIAYADPAPVFTISNTTGVKLKIVSNANAQEAGTCAAGAELAPGASCTATAVCPTPPVVTPALVELTAQQDPTVGCDTTTTRIPSIDFRAMPGGAFYTAHAYTPVPGDPPLLAPDVSLGSPIFTYTPNAENWGPDSANFFDTDNVTSGVATVTYAAPQGYGFGPALEPSQTWTIPYTKCENTGIAV